MTIQTRLARVFGLAGIATFAVVSHASAQLATISLGKITAHQNCKVYQESAGSKAVFAQQDTVVAAKESAAVAADRDHVVAAKSGAVVAAQRTTVASFSSWRTWLVKDCVSDFPTLKTSLQAALAASGKLAVKGSGGKYVLSGAISQIGGMDDPATQTISTGSYSVASQGIFVTMDVTLKDASGRIVYGGLLTKHLETGSNIQTPGMETGSYQPNGEATYTQLQNQIALAVARLAAFHIVPLQVTGNDGGQIRLNYGSPLLTLGTIVHATSPDGGATVRYNVVSADAGGATAEKDGDGDAARIVPGSTATVIEADDPAANERKYKRVDLP
jgi:hypothetical protein